MTSFNKIKENEQVFLLDVRTPEEFVFANIGGINIELSTLSERLGEIPKDKVIYCLCHHGVRSAHACHFLISHEFNAINILGGIDAWSHMVNPSIPRY